jgi:hypothetical protein
VHPTAGVQEFFFTGNKKERLSSEQCLQLCKQLLVGHQDEVHEDVSREGCTSIELSQMAEPIPHAQGNRACFWLF